MLDYGFFGRGPLGAFGTAIDVVIYWLISGGQLMPGVF
ncbi:hypothetical protein Br6_05011 [Rhodococcus sp. Br-6]|nr:hypothetical protein Br6_05011 [Rhodococcus sp. Br-6]